jgi:hypothetical protein
MAIDDIMDNMHVYTGNVSGEKRQRKVISLQKLCIPIRDIEYGNER